MCNPTLLLIGSAALTVGGAYVQNKAAGQAQKYNNIQAERSAKVADAQALDATRQGQQEANVQRLKTRLQLGEQRAIIGAQGVELSGTALDILGQTAGFGETDVLRIQENAARKAHGFNVDAYNIRSQNQLDRYQTKVGKVGTWLTAGSQLAGMAYSHAQAGGFSSSPKAATGATVSRSYSGANVYGPR